MPRNILDESKIHPAIREQVAEHGSEIIEQVKAAIASDTIVIVGMRQNPFPKKARKLLDAAGFAYTYMEFGSYFSGWKRRMALKMWTGWPTFPMIFVRGTLIGGASDLKRLIDSGGLR